MTAATTPEVLYGDTADKAGLFAAQSVGRAKLGDAWGAVHAMFASDIATLQKVVLERIMNASPQPERQFFAVASAVSAALSRYAGDAQPIGNAQDAALAARAGMESAFDKPVVKLLAGQYADTRHLAGLEFPRALSADAAVAGRLGGETPSNVMKARQESSQTGFGHALDLYRQGQVEQAVQTAYAADLAGFEGYLIEAAISVGDWSMATVDLRWWLACDGLARIPGLPANFLDAVRLIRGRLAGAVGPVEALRLTDRFHPLPSG